MEALPFLTAIAKAKRQPIYVLMGDEDFLVRRCREAIIAHIVGEADPTFAVANYTGDKLNFSVIRNELETVPFLATARIVIVERADHVTPPSTKSFVSENRPALEKYFAAPSKTGVLILEVKSFSETTLLAKALPDSAKVVCKAPKEHLLVNWCIGWAKTTHAKKLSPDAAGQLMQLVGPSMGLLSQELAKLSTSIGALTEITSADIERLIPRSRSANVFNIMNAVGDGQPAAALGLLTELLDDGEAPLAIVGALAFTLRKLATIGRLVSQGEPLGIAMDKAGITNWNRQVTERQVKHLGRRRLEQISDWLVEVNLGLKGGSPLPERLQMEMLVVKLARPRT